MSTTKRPGAPRLRRLTSLFLLVLVMLGVAALPGQAPPAAAQQSGTTVSRTVTDGTGRGYNLSVTVSKTTNLQSRENVSLNWSGFEPTRNFKILDPLTANRSEYPVVILQCRGGSADQTAPLDPTHCASTGDPRQVPTAIYRGTDTAEAPNPPVTNRTISQHLGFTAVDGTFYPMYNFASDDPALGGQPAELQRTTAVPINYRAEWTGANGRRDNVPFEVRNASQMPRLGCSNTVPCSIVVVPILNPVCVPTAVAECTEGPRTPVGPGISDSSNRFLRHSTWWLTTNWRNRLTIPITLAPPPDFCDAVDPRPAVPVDGSELDAAVMQQWVPAFCLDPARFKLTYGAQPEPTSRTLLTSNDGISYGQNAILTTLPVTGSPRPVVHSPATVTGFAVVFFLDDKDNNQITELRLTPRLLAKLVTQSYPGGYRAHPTVGGNPPSLLRDPDFFAANPALVDSFNPLNTAVKNMITPSVRTDVIWELTRYITSDPEARAWLDGAPDEHTGMVVNPEFRGLPLPILATELRDTWLEPPEQRGQCAHLTDPALGREAQGVDNMERAAIALLDGQPQSASICKQQANDEFAWSKPDRMVVGNRTLLALTGTANAARYLLPTVQLQVHKLSNGNRVFVGPSTQSMTVAMGYTTQDQDTGTLVLDHEHLAPNAYPGTMFTYGAVPTAGLGRPIADQYADFLAFAGTDGQAVGTGNGQLPAGYAPLPQVLRDYARQAAQAVRDQLGQVPAPPPDLPGAIRDELGLPPPFDWTSPDAQSSVDGLGGPADGQAPGADTGPADAAAAAAADDRPGTTVATRGNESWLAGWGLPVLLGVGLLAGVLAPLVVVANQPGHPVRRLLGALGTRAAAAGGRVSGVFRRKP